jgi:hypothetical protein
VTGFGLECMAGFVGIRTQSPAPGFGEKYWSLSGFPSHSLGSGGGAFLIVIFGQIFAYSAFSDSHFSNPGPVVSVVTRRNNRKNLQMAHLKTCNPTLAKEVWQSMPDATTRRVATKLR